MASWLKLKKWTFCFTSNVSLWNLYWRSDLLRTNPMGVSSSIFLIWKKIVLNDWSFCSVHLFEMLRRCLGLPLNQAVVPNQPSLWSKLDDLITGNSFRNSPYYVESKLYVESCLSGFIYWFSSPVFKETVRWVIVSKNAEHQSSSAIEWNYDWNSDWISSWLQRLFSERLFSM